MEGCVSEHAYVRRGAAVMTVPSVMAADAGCSSTRPASVSGHASRGDAVWLALSGEQVDRVVREASDRGAMSLVLSGLTDMQVVLAANPTYLENPRLSRSLLLGLLVLASFELDGSYRAITEIAQIRGLSPSTAHRYVTTLVAVGLVERDPRTREYRLANAG